MRLRNVFRAAGNVGSSGSLSLPLDRIDAYVEKQRTLQHIPGLSVAIAREGELLFTRGYGFADLEWEIPAAPDTVYQIASITKQFTAMLVMILVEEGKIELDGPISAYLTDLPDLWNTVTVRQLLAHTGGVPNFTNVPDLVRMAIVPATPAEVLKTVADKPLDFAPGEKRTYSNTGYYLLGMILEKAGQKPFADLIRERIFTPLGMDSSSVNDWKTVIKDRAHGYVWEEDHWTNAPVISMSWVYSAGAILSTVTDLVKWDAALYAEKLVTRATLEQMWTPVTLNDGTTSDYGFGWGVHRPGGHRRIHHSGGIFGFVSHLSHFPDDRLMICVLTNTGCDADRIVAGISLMLLPDLQPTSGVPASLSAERLPEFTGYYPFPSSGVMEITVEDGKLQSRPAGTSRPPDEWEAESDAVFFSRERFDRLNFDGGEQGIRGLFFAVPGEKENLRLARIGPLFAEIPSEADPDPESTAPLEVLLRTLAAGIDPAADLPGTTEGLRKRYGGAPFTAAQGLEALTFRGMVTLPEQNVERNAAKVATVTYCTMNAAGKGTNLLVYRTEDGLLAGLDLA